VAGRRRAPGRAIPGGFFRGQGPVAPLRRTGGAGCRDRLKLVPPGMLGRAAVLGPVSRTAVTGAGLCGGDGGWGGGDYSSAAGQTFDGGFFSGGVWHVDALGTMNRAVVE